jgi:hypothetical protein
VIKEGAYEGRIVIVAIKVCNVRSGGTLLGVEARGGCKSKCTTRLLKDGGTKKRSIMVRPENEMEIELKELSDREGEMK